MKKNLTFALTAAIALVFAGCNDPQKNPDGFVINISPATVNIGVGETQKLTAVVTPTGSNLAIKWTSSDEEVATVNASGIVTAVAVGTATITASAEGATEGTCAVTVSNDAVFDNFEFSNFGIFGTPAMMEYTRKFYFPSIGDSATCQVGTASLYIWDNNLVYVKNQGFSGTGFIAFTDVNIWWIIDCPAMRDAEGSYVGTADGFFVDTCNNRIKLYTAETGTILDEQKYGTWWKQFVAYQNEKADTFDVSLYRNSMQGAHMCILYADDDFAQSWNLGNLTKAHFYTDDNDAFKYEAHIDWFDYVNPDRYYGLLCTDKSSETGIPASIVEPFDMRYIDRDYTNITSTESSVVRSSDEQYFVGDMSHYYAEKPEIQMMNPTQLYRK